MAKLTQNQKTVLNALIGEQTFSNQRWIPTSYLSECTGLSKLVIAGVMCSLINRGLVVSLKSKQESVYQFTVDGNMTMMEATVEANKV